MPGWELKLITAEAQRLVTLAADDAVLRAELRALANEILAATEIPSPPEAASVPRPVSSPAERSSSAAVVSQPQLKETETLRELTLGRSRPLPAEDPPPAQAETGLVVSDDDLSEVEARCRLKAEGARWAATRQRPVREGPGPEIGSDPEDPEIVAWADRLTESFYWANSSGASDPADPSLLDEVGGCFEAVGEAVALVRDSAANHPARLDQTLPLLAEALSALRAALQGVGATDDPDALHAFEWLKTTAARHRVYIKRYMRADDPADPGRWPDLLGRIGRSSGGHQRRSKQRGALIEQLRSRLKVIEQGTGTQQDWQSVIETVDALVGAGVPPSDREVRESLLPVIDDLPDRDDLPHGFRLVLREIDRSLSTLKPPSGPAITHEPTAEVKEARRLLRGRSVVLIGGTCRRESQEALKTVLELRDLIWIETREHQSIGTFEPSIARPDVALVLLAIRWSSHAFGDVKQFCDRHGKPLVRLPGGYNPNQVAAQVLAQSSEQLGGG